MLEVPTTFHRLSKPNHQRFTLGFPMHHLSVFEYTSAATAAKSLVDMPAIADPGVTIVNSHPIFQQPVWLWAFYGFGQTDITDFQLTTPKLRATALEHFRPFDAATAPTTRPPICNHLSMPIPLNAIDENSIQLSASTGTDTNKYYAMAWFGDGNMNAAQGPIVSVLFTAAVTRVAGAWANGPITLQQSLPAGRFAVVGMDVYGTGMYGARLAFPNQVWRPGCIAGAVAGFFNAPCFRLGKMGTWGTFDSYAQPSLDVIGTGANTAQTGVLDLVRL